eukprot:NODE_43_length_33755_cov_1.178542.p27 type:complete len:185 gc:universal NODE_43_length_33755_cov_1.178542:21693-22247(+)
MIVSLLLTFSLDFKFDPQQRYILFAHNHRSEQSVWYDEEYWTTFSHNYKGNIQLMKMDESDPTTLCMFDIKAYPVVRLIYNNTYGRVLQLESLNDIAMYKFDESQMPSNLATYFTNYTNEVSKMCTVQSKIFHHFENLIYNFESNYSDYRSNFPYPSLYALGHDLPLCILLVYYVVRKTYQLLK